MQAARQLLVQALRSGFRRQHGDDGGLDAGAGHTAFQADGWLGRRVAGRAVGDGLAIAGGHRSRHIQAPLQQFQQPGLEGLAAIDRGAVAPNAPPKRQPPPTAWSAPTNTPPVR
ncbi:hypothetical protein G6F55_013956 [Rhizopus delemar]|nr:hypothetical protein G6F55_013956 [Rhizopus delemar]